MTIERFRQLHEEWKQTKRPALLQEHRPVLPNLSLQSSSLQPPILVCQKMGLTWDLLGTYLGLTWDSLGTHLGLTWIHIPLRADGIVSVTLFESRHKGSSPPERLK